jgi:hypothetical protein
MTSTEGPVARLRLTRCAGLAAAAGVLVAGLTGCWAGDHGGILTLTAEETRIDSCPVTRSVPVETLDTVDRPGCLPLGSPLEFPDGTLLETGQWAAGGTQSSSRSTAHYGWTNVGIYGVVAAQYDRNCDDLVVWGRAEAVSKLRDAFGGDLGYC